MILFLLFTLAFARFTEIDYKIFDANDQLSLAYGRNESFYSALGVSNTATINEVNKAYRVLSQSLHPDKTTDLGNIAKQKALSSVVPILRNHRDIYDRHLAKGFPVWRYNSVNLVAPGTITTNTSLAYLLSFCLSWPYFPLFNTHQLG